MKKTPSKQFREIIKSLKSQWVTPISPISIDPGENPTQRLVVNHRGLRTRLNEPKNQNLRVNSLRCL
jgi:hypothetical protein